MARKFLKYLVLLVIAGNLLVLLYVILGKSTPAAKPLPNPNGYDDFAKAGQMITNRPDYDKLSQPELASTVSSNREAIKLLRVGLTKECRFPMDYTQTMERWLPDMISLKQLEPTLCAEGRLAEMEGRTNDAAQIYLEGIRFGQEAFRGGVLISRLVDVACESIASRKLSPLIGGLDARQCREVVRALESIDAREEPSEEVLRREKDWSHRVFGIKGQIQELFAYKMTRASHQNFTSKVTSNTLQRRQMMFSFAVRAYTLDHLKPPQTHADLVPAYLKAIPKDPTTEQDIGLPR